MKEWNPQRFQKRNAQMFHWIQFEKYVITWAFACEANTNAFLPPSFQSPIVHTPREKNLQREPDIDSGKESRISILEICK